MCISTGVLVTNVAARNEEMKLEALRAFRNAFCAISCLPLQEDINDIVVGFKKCPRNGIRCRNEFCSEKTVDSVGKCSETSATGKTEPENDERVSSEKTKIERLSLEDGENATISGGDSESHKFREWRLCGVGECEGVRERVCGLVSVARENGGNVEGLESEITKIVMYQTQ